MKATLGGNNFVLGVISLLAIWGPGLSEQNQHYCSISRDHTLCKFQGIGPRCKSPMEVGIPARDRQQIMQLHNSLRQMVATGAESRGRGGAQPSASNMRQMEWDDELALTAQRLAEQCKYTHDCLNCRKVDRFLTGQNLYQFSENILRDGSNWEQAIMAWYDEVKLWNPRHVDYFEFIKELGHYTQMLWADTYKMGCGYAYYKDGKWNRKLYVCNYGPAGNIITTQMYKRGPACSECPEGTSCSNQYPGLCSSGGGGGHSFFQRPQPTTTPATTPRPRPTQTTTRRTTTTTTTTTPRPTTTTTRPTTTTRRTTTTTTTTTPRPTTTRRTTTLPTKIVFNELESNELVLNDHFTSTNQLDFSNRLGFGKNSKNNRNNHPFSVTPKPHQETRNNRFHHYQTTNYPTTFITTPRTTPRITFSRFVTTRKPFKTTPTTTPKPKSSQKLHFEHHQNQYESSTKKPFTFSPRVFPEETKRNRIKNSIDSFPTRRPGRGGGAADNRITSGTINVPSKTQNRFDNSYSKPETKVVRVSQTPALSVEDSNSILLFCDFDFAKCPVRYMGEVWNYTVYETPGYGHGFSSVVRPGDETNLQIRSDIFPSTSGGLICVHFRFVHYLFGVDGGYSKTNGLDPHTSRPVKFTVTATPTNEDEQKTNAPVEFSDKSKSAYDWLTGRIQFKDLHSQFLLSFQVPKNPLGLDNQYLALDDILITQGVCHT